MPAPHSAARSGEAGRGAPAFSTLPASGCLHYNNAPLSGAATEVGIPTALITPPSCEITRKGSTCSLGYCFWLFREKSTAPCSTGEGSVCSLIQASFAHWLYLLKVGAFCMPPWDPLHDPYGSRMSPEPGDKPAPTALRRVELHRQNWRIVSRCLPVFPQPSCGLRQPKQLLLGSARDYHSRHCRKTCAWKQLTHDLSFN